MNMPSARIITKGHAIRPSIAISAIISRPLRRTTWLGRLLDMLAIGRGRRRLAELDRVQLSDIGLSPDQALAEATRPIWDVPPGWRM